MFKRAGCEEFLYGKRTLLKKKHLSLRYAHGKKKSSNTEDFVALPNLGFFFYFCSTPRKRPFSWKFRIFFNFFQIFLKILNFFENFENFVKFRKFRKISATTPHDADGTCLQVLIEASWSRRCTLELRVLIAGHRSYGSCPAKQWTFKDMQKTRIKYFWVTELF